MASMAMSWAERAPRQVAMREKKLGVWQEYTWAGMWELVETAAHGLLALGVDVGDRVAIHSEDRHEWVVLDLAAVAVRAVTVGLYPTNPTAEVGYLIGDCTPVVFLAEDQEQIDKVLEVPDEEARSVRRILYVEPRGLGAYSDPRLLFWDDFLAMGRGHSTVNPDAMVERMHAATEDDLMTLIYTSGTTGPPKGVMISNANAAYCIGKVVHEADRIPGGDPSESRGYGAHLPAAVPCRRTHLLHLDASRRWIVVELRGVDRCRRRESARNTADTVLRSPEDLGAHARFRHDQGRQRHRVEAARPPADPVVGIVRRTAQEC